MRPVAPEFVRRTISQTSSRKPATEPRTMPTTAPGSGPLKSYVSGIARVVPWFWRGVRECVCGFGADVWCCEVGIIDEDIEGSEGSGYVVRREEEDAKVASGGIVSCVSGFVSEN